MSGRLDDRDNDPETPTTRASVGSPGFVPPVIFAGLASPCESARSITKTKRFQELIRGRDIRKRLPHLEFNDCPQERDVVRHSARSQSQTPSVYCSRSSVVDCEPLSSDRSDANVSPSRCKSVPRTASSVGPHEDSHYRLTRTPSVSSSRLSTPRIPASIRAEEGRSSLLEQIADLESALSHSKAREEFLVKTKETLASELTEKELKIKEMQTCLKNLDQDNRRLKNNVRELMGATLSSDPEIQEPPQNHTMNEEPDQTIRMNLKGEHTGYPEEPTIDGDVRMDENLSEEDQMKNKQLLMKTLHITKAYLQKVLRRNTEIESRLKQLEDGNDAQIRSLHDQLDTFRQERLSLTATLSRTKLLVDEQKEEIGLLHRELRDMHERQRLHRVVVHELQDIKEENDFLRDALAAEKTEVQKIALEWEQEKAILLADLSFERSKKTPVLGLSDPTPDASTTCALALRIDELEGSLDKAYREHSEYVAVHDKERSELQAQLRQVTQHHEITKRRECEMQNLKVHLEEELKLTRDQLTASQRNVVALREEMKSLLDQVSELEGVKCSLHSSQEKIESQAKQIQRHLQTIREANDRYAELLESKTVLDCLLHTHQKEKEKNVAETVKTHEQLYDQSSTYRQRLENAAKEIASLKKQLAEKQEALHHAAESTDVARLKEIRQLKESLNHHKRQATLECQRKLSELRDNYEKELMDLRQQKELKMDALVTEYEKYIKELKTMQEKKLQFVQQTKDQEIQKCMDLMTKRLTESQAVMKERLAKQRSLHEQELNTLQSSHCLNLQNQLEEKMKEIDNLTQQLSCMEKDYVKRLNLAEQKAMEATTLLQHYKSQKVEAEEERESSYTALLVERDELKRRLEDFTGQQQQQKKKKEESLTEELLTMKRQKDMMEKRLGDTQEELKVIQNKLLSVQQDNGTLRKIIQEFEQSIGKTIDTPLGKELGNMKKRLNDTDMCKKEYQDSSEHLEVIGKLNEKIQTLETTKQQLEEKLTAEVNFFQEKLKSQEERLQSLVPLQLHITQLLERNTELENLVTAEENRFTEALGEKTAEVTALETKVSKLQHQVKEQEAEIEALKARVTCLDDQREYLQSVAAREREAQDTIFVQQQRIDELTTQLNTAVEAKARETKESNRSVSGTILVKQERTEISRECIQTLKHLGENLAQAQKENSRLVEEIKKLEQASKNFSRLTLEYSIQSQRIQAQEETIEMLQERIQNKQTLIEELSAQLRSEGSSSDDLQWRASEYDATRLQQLEEKLCKLTKECQQLSDEKLNYDHERSSFQHRLDLEQQLLFQCMEQKEKQMQHLIETNKRAEALLLRNTELEALLFNLQLEQESHRCTGACSDRSLVSSSNAGEGSSEDQGELDHLRKLIDDKEKRIQRLLEELRTTKNTYTKEIETLMTRLHFATLEQSLVPLSSEDDLLRLLVEKTTELQREVKRLQTERDENHRQMSATQTYSPRGASNDQDVAHLQLCIERLVEEREHLRKQVTALGKSHEDIDHSAAEMESTSEKPSLRFRLQFFVQRCHTLRDLYTSQCESESNEKSCLLCGKEISAFLSQLENLIQDMELTISGEKKTPTETFCDDPSTLSLEKFSGTDSGYETSESLDLVNSAVRERTLYPSLFNASPLHIEREVQPNLPHNGSNASPCTYSTKNSDGPKKNKPEEDEMEEDNRRCKRARGSLTSTPAKQQKCSVQHLNG